MGKMISKIKSYSPVVRKRSLYSALKLADRFKKDVLSHEYELTSLRMQVEDRIRKNEALVRENRALHLALQRTSEYNIWLSQNYPTKEILEKQHRKSKSFKNRPLISIILPVYNTNPNYLSTCIESVLNQSYDNWQLCIVDDASSNPATLDSLQKYSDLNDSRIIIKHSKTNGHISVASNKAIELAKGEFVAILDHDDLLWPNALYEVVKLLQEKPSADLIYSDEDKINSSEELFIHYDPFFKPDWNPHLLTSINYITHFCVLRSRLVREIGGFDKTMVGAQDWDLFLRISEKTDKIYHIPTILYSWRAHLLSTAKDIKAKTYATNSQRKALNNYFVRNFQHNVKLTKTTHGYWYPRHEVEDDPLISIIIPTKDKVDYIQRCILSILSKTTYNNYEIILVDTGSRERATKRYYKQLQAIGPDRLQIKYWQNKSFNYSLACNFGAKESKGKYLVMLNNDTEVITGSWLQDMLGYAQLQQVAAVGVKLLFPNFQIQHAGVVTGIGSTIKPVAGHPGTGMNHESSDLLQEIYTNMIRDASAVTAACLMISAKKFWEIKGFDPKLRVTFNDVDLCLKLKAVGYTNIYLPFVELIHHESVSIGRIDKKRDMKEFSDSIEYITRKWDKILTQADPYYNKNFNIMSSNFGLDIMSSND